MLVLDAEGCHGVGRVCRETFLKPGRLLCDASSGQRVPEGLGAHCDQLGARLAKVLRVVSRLYSSHPDDGE